VVFWPGCSRHPGGNRPISEPIEALLSLLELKSFGEDVYLGESSDDPVG
jgi:hypothetical protein